MVLYPLVCASIATAYTWIVGRTSPAGVFLRKAAPPLVVASVAVAALGTLGGAVSASVEIVAVQHLGWACAVLAEALRFARDPIGPLPSQEKPAGGPYR